MATSDAWQAGVDLAQGKSSKKKDDDGTSKSSSKPTGGLLGLAAGAIKAPKAKSTLKKAQFGESGLDTSSDTTTALIPSFKRGGRVKHTGLAMLHRGEHVVPAGKHRVRKASPRKTFIKA
jgi:hypothetical protein